MNDFFQTVFSRGPLTGAGGTLLFVGLLFWNFPGVYKKVFALRNAYAEKLRIAGEKDRAKKIDTETTVILRRTPIYGRVLVVIGIIVILASFFASK
jgi:hypothetical protein